MCRAALEVNILGLLNKTLGPKGGLLTEKGHEAASENSFPLSQGSHMSPAPRRGLHKHASKLCHFDIRASNRKFKDESQHAQIEQKGGGWVSPSLDSCVRMTLLLT